MRAAARSSNCCAIVVPIRFCHAFDLLWLDGDDLRGMSLNERVPTECSQGVLLMPRTWAPEFPY
jgi:hypothetical protein